MNMPLHTVKQLFHIFPRYYILVKYLLLFYNNKQIISIAATCHNQQLTNGQSSYDRPREYPENTIESFTCNPGYNLAGSQSLTCQASGNWDRYKPYCLLSNY